MKTVICVDMEGRPHEVSANDLRWRPSVYAIVIRDDELLLAKEEGKYTLPGGAINLGELPDEAVVREAKEETGVRVANPRPVSFASNFFKLTASSKGAHIQSLLLYYQCDLVGGELALDHLPEEDRPFHAMPEWVPIDDLPTIRLASSYDWRPLVERLARADYRH